MPVHAPEAHSRSHWHASSQSTSPHAPAPPHVIAQREPDRHSTSLHAPAPLHAIVHVQPDGHVIVPAQPAVDVHSTKHVRAVSSHDVQSAGQFGTMQ